MAKWNALDNPYKKYCKNHKANREMYLRQLAEDYDVDYRKVYAMADMLGKEDDFDGLIEHLNELPVWG